MTDSSVCPTCKHMASSHDNWGRCIGNRNLCGCKMTPEMVEDSGQVQSEAGENNDKANVTLEGESKITSEAKWVCTCGRHNYESHLWCLWCHKAKPCGVCGGSGGFKGWCAGCGGTGSATGTAKATSEEAADYWCGICEPGQAFDSKHELQAHRRDDVHTGEPDDTAEGELCDARDCTQDWRYALATKGQRFFRVCEEHYKELGGEDE